MAISTLLALPAAAQPFEEDRLDHSSFARWLIGIAWFRQMDRVAGDTATPRAPSIPPRKATKAELEAALAGYQESIRTHEMYIDWLKGKGADRRDIEAAEWIRDSERGRARQVQEQLRNKEYLDAGRAGDSSAWTQSFRTGAYRSSGQGSLRSAGDQSFRQGATQTPSPARVTREQTRSAPPKGRQNTTAEADAALLRALHEQTRPVEDALRKVKKAGHR